jgi:hypothetical protein
MPKSTGMCPECHGYFEHFPSQPRKFCSQSCRSKYNSRLQIPTKPRRGTETPCEQCGKPVYQTARARRDGFGKFCSRACLSASQAKPPTVKDCLRCGKEMRLKPSQAERMYCSKACDAQARTKQPLPRIYNGRPARVNGGYVFLWEPNHPNKTMRGWQAEHRLVAESMLGRYLTSEGQVHHVNGVKTDNRPENLQVLTAREHTWITQNEIREQRERERAELEEYRRRFGPLEGGAA